MLQCGIDVVDEVVRVPEQSEVAVVLSFDVPDTDWQQRPNAVDTRARVRRSVADGADLLARTNASRIVAL